MNKRLSSIFLISFILFNVRAAVVLPSENETVSAAAFLPSALDELKADDTYVLFDDGGHPYGFVENGLFVDSIQYGNLTVLPFLGENGSVIGGTSMDQAAREIASLRSQQGDDLEWDILREGDFLDYAYYSQRYDGLEDFLGEGLNIDGRKDSVDLLNGLDPSLANEFLSMYEALDLNQVGYSHYDQLLETLNKMNDEDLSKYLDEETLEKVNEFMDQIEKDIIDKALEEILKNIGEDELRMLYDLLRQLDLSTLYEIARDYVREMARDGTLDDIGDTLKESKIPSEIMEKFTDSGKEFVQNKLWDMLPKNFNYYFLAVSAIILIVTLRKVGG